VVSIRKATEMTNEEKDWKSKKLAIEDPYSTKRNLCRSIQHPSVFNYIADSFKTGYLYFGTIQTSHGPIITKILQSEDDEEDVEEGLGDWTLESWLAAKGTVLTKSQTLTAVRLVPKNMVTFSFSAEHLTDGTVPAVICAVCSNEGHTTNSCPEEQLPPLLPLPQLREVYLRLLDKICVSVTRNCEPTEAELNNRDHIMRDLNGYIKRIFRGAELTLFGSSSNGFAFRHSDLDISLTFVDEPTSENLDCIGIIEELAEKIRRMAGVRNVQAITSAKVPIIKLFYQNLNVEADISLYNVLARENTKLLSLYAELDQRVRILGYMVKHFAKVCDIGDASRGSLSSYAYILMMIFFLQQTSPAVIPVVQEMYSGEKPEKMVDGWNSWFQADHKIISGWKSKNRASVGQLWIEFLSFYAGDWDDRKLVVSIRQLKPLTKFEKMWNSPCIAIEDPFELNHNLGVGISRRMNIYIKKTFINGRGLFGNPRPTISNGAQIPRGYRSLQDYFFDHRLLTDGAPPNDRGCRACGKIGHLVADCPRKKAGEARKLKNKEQRNRTMSEQTGSNEIDRRDVRNRTKSEIPATASNKVKQNKTFKANDNLRLESLRKELGQIIIKETEKEGKKDKTKAHEEMKAKRKEKRDAKRRRKDEEKRGKNEKDDEEKEKVMETILKGEKLTTTVKKEVTVTAKESVMETEMTTEKEKKGRMTLKRERKWKKKAEAELQAEIESKAEAEMKAVAERKAEAEMKAGAELQAKDERKAKTEMKAVAEMKDKYVTKALAELKAETMMKTEIQMKAETQMKDETEMFDYNCVQPIPVHSVDFDYLSSSILTPSGLNGGLEASEQSAPGQDFESLHSEASLKNTEEEKEIIVV